MPYPVAVYLVLCGVLGVSSVYLVWSRYFKEGLFGCAALLWIAGITGAQLLDFFVRGAYFAREWYDVAFLASVTVIIFRRAVLTAVNARCHGKPQSWIEAL